MLDCAREEGERDVHLWIEKAGSSFNYTDSSIESIDLISLVGRACNDSPKSQTKILWV